MITTDGTRPTPGPASGGAATTDPTFAEFYTAHVTRLIVQLHAYLGDHAQAQDVVQEAFARALPRWSRLSGYDDPLAWVRRVAWNLATSRWRQLRKFHRYAARERAEHVPPPSADVLALHAALRDLPDRLRRPIVMHYLAGMSLAEIAEHERVAVGTVKSWLHRGRTALAAALADPREETTRHG